MRLTTLLAGLLLAAAGGIALADPAGDIRDRGDHGADSWRGSGQRDERRGAPPERRWDRDRRDARDWSRDAWRYRDDWRARGYPRYDRDRPYWRGYDTPRRDGYYGYGYRGYGYGYRGYDYPRRWHRDDNDDDVAFTIAGGVLGGIIGNHAVAPENRAAGTVFGAIIGGVLGHAIGQSNNDDHGHWSPRRHDDGRDDRYAERRYPR